MKLTPQGERVLGALTIEMRTEMQTAAPILVNALKNVMTHTNPKPGPRDQSFEEVGR